VTQANRAYSHKAGDVAFQCAVSSPVSAATPPPSSLSPFYTSALLLFIYSYMWSYSYRFRVRARWVQRSLNFLRVRPILRSLSFAGTGGELKWRAEPSASKSSCLMFMSAVGVFCSLWMPRKLCTIWCS